MEKRLPKVGEVWHRNTAHKLAKVLHISDEYIFFEFITSNGQKCPGAWTKEGFLSEFKPPAKEYWIVEYDTAEGDTGRRVYDSYLRAVSLASCTRNSKIIHVVEKVD